MAACVARRLMGMTRRFTFATSIVTGSAIFVTARSTALPPALVKIPQHPSVSEVVDIVVARPFNPQACKDVLRNYAVLHHDDPHLGLLKSATRNDANVPKYYNPIKCRPGWERMYSATFIALMLKGDTPVSVAEDAIAALLEQHQHTTTTQNEKKITDTPLSFIYKERLAAWMQCGLDYNDGYGGGSYVPAVGKSVLNLAEFVEATASPDTLVAKRRFIKGFHSVGRDKSGCQV